MKSFVFLLCLVALGSCGENFASINVKNAINVVSDKFISYEASFPMLMSEFLKEHTLKSIDSISPAFIRLDGFTSYLRNGQQFNSSDVASFFELLM